MDQRLEAEPRHDGVTNMRRSTLLASFVCCALAQAANGQLILSTGLDATNTLITTGGTNDAHWTVTEVTGGPGPAQVTTPTSADWFGAWVANGPNSAWIARNASQSSNGGDLYTWSRTFDLSSFTLSSVSMSGSWTVDDSANLSLNGTVISSLSGGNWTALQPFSVSAGSPLFNAGLNTLSITLTSNDNFLEAARLEGTVTGETSVPEPGSIVLAGVVGGLGLGYTWRRRRRKKAAAVATAG